jgi:3-hydroxybutyryl-CoA dehydratase
MEKEYFEDYTVGEKFITPARTITETDIGMFAALTGDWHELHTNVEYAKNTPFGERIAHGMLVLVVGSALSLRLGNNVTLPKSFIAFYGMEKVRFVHPTKIGDTIHCESEVIELINKDDKRGVMVSEARIKNQRGEDCCICVSKILCGRRPQ